MAGAPRADPDFGDLAERDHGRRRTHFGGHRDQHFAGNGLRVAAQVARVTHGDTETLAAFDGGGDHFATEGSGDDVHDFTNRQTVTGQGDAVGHDVEVEAAGDPLGEGAAGTGYGLDDAFDFLGQAFHFNQVGAEDLDADRRPDPGGQHVDARLDRHRPRIGDAGELQRLVEFGD